MSPRQLFACLLVLVVVHCGHSLPTLFAASDAGAGGLGSAAGGGDVDGSVLPEFARPGETPDLQKATARLHRTLFLLNTSDLLKKARLLGSLATGGSGGGNTQLARAKRHSPRLGADGKPIYINMIKLRKPTLSIDEMDKVEVSS